MQYIIQAFGKLGLTPDASRYEVSRAYMSATSKEPSSRLDQKRHQELHQAHETAATFVETFFYYANKDPLQGEPQLHLTDGTLYKQKFVRHELRSDWQLPDQTAPNFVTRAVSKVITTINLLLAPFRFLSKKISNLVAEYITASLVGIFLFVYVSVAMMGTPSFTRFITAVRKLNHSLNQSIGSFDLPFF